MEYLKFSIILPVEHSGDYLYKVLKSLNNMVFPYELFEVIVAGSPEEKEAKKIVGEMQKLPFSLKYIEASSRKRSAKLNIACLMAKGDVWCFADDDCEFFSDYLDKLNEILKKEKNIGAIGGRDKAENTCSSFELSVECVLNSFLGTGGIRKKGGIDKYYPRHWNMVILKKTAFETALKDEKGQIYFWDETLDLHEEIELIKRIETSGKNIVYAPDLLIKHSRSTTLLSFGRRQVRGVFMSRRLGIYNMPHLILSFFTLFMLLSPFFSLFSYRIACMYIIVAAIYILSILALTLKGWVIYKRFSMFLYIPLLCIIIHFSRGLAYIYSFITGKT